MSRIFGSRPFGAIAAAIAAGLIPGISFASDKILSLNEAVTIAVTADDPAYTQFDVRASAQEDRAVSDAQLPDPIIKTEIANLPIDTFAFGQEPMTQLQVGLRQEFARGSTLRLNRERRNAEANIERMKRAQAVTDATLAVRMAWLHKFHALIGQRIIEESRAAVNELVDALSASYAQGKLTSQDVLRAELELSLLDDKLAELRQNEAVAEAELSRFIGQDAFRPLPENLPAFAAPGTIQELEATLTRHPVVLIDDATISVEETEIGLAKQAYKPKWSLESEYGFRSADRPDFASVGVRFSVPILTGKRQDRALSAARKEKSAAELKRATTLLDLRGELVKTYADWTQLEKRLALYDAVVIQRASETANASISAYGGGQADFPELIRSQLAELDAKLMRHDLRIQYAVAWARLSYLAGDNQ